MIFKKFLFILIIIVYFNLIFFVSSLVNPSTGGQVIVDPNGPGGSGVEGSITSYLESGMPLEEITKNPSNVEVIKSNPKFMDEMLNHLKNNPEHIERDMDVLFKSFSDTNSKELADMITGMPYKDPKITQMFNHIFDNGYSTNFNPTEISKILDHSTGIKSDFTNINEIEGLRIENNNLVVHYGGTDTTYIEITEGMKITLKSDGNIIIEQEGTTGGTANVKPGSNYKFQDGKHFVDGEVVKEATQNTNQNPTPPAPIPPPEDDAPTVPEVVIPDSSAPTEGFDGTRENGEVSATGGTNMIFNDESYYADYVFEFSITHPYSYNIIDAQHLNHRADNLNFQLTGANSIRHFETNSYIGSLVNGKLYLDREIDLESVKGLYLKNTNSGILVNVDEVGFFESDEFDLTNSNKVTYFS
jgi:hypothetical protein